MNMHYDDGTGQVRSFARGLLQSGRFAPNGHSLTITYAPKSLGFLSLSLSVSARSLSFCTWTEERTGRYNASEHAETNSGPYRLPI